MRTKYLLLVGLAALLGSCQNENEPKTSSVPGTEGDYRIIIEGDETDSPSRAGEKSFVGGTASGAGLYDGDRTATVSATPNSDYEIDYFWGGPASEPQKYNTTSTAATTYDVPIGGEDHTFHLKFKEKKREVTINAGTGGRVNPSGPADYKVMKAHNITATPNSGYEFTGWSVSGSGITLGNSSNASTTFTLASNYSSNGTITANFIDKSKIKIANVHITHKLIIPLLKISFFIQNAPNVPLTVKFSFSWSPNENGVINYNKKYTENCTLQLKPKEYYPVYEFKFDNLNSIEIVEAPHVTSVLPASGEDMDGNRYVVKW